MKQRVLILCSYNSCRSQIAEGWLRHLKGEKYEVYSAGTKKAQVHPIAIEVMEEAGVDMSHHESKELDQFLDQEFDLVVTVCDNAKEACPHFPGAEEYMHKAFSDPFKVEGTPEERLAEFRKTRDEIRAWVEAVF